MSSRQLLRFSRVARTVDKTRLEFIAMSMKQFLTRRRKKFHIISAQECHQKIKKIISDLMSTKIEKH